MAANNKKELRQLLRAKRLAMPDRLEKAAMLQSTLRSWLLNRTDQVIGAYWPIHGEFDPLPALRKWQELSSEGDKKIISLPVADKNTRQLTFHEWYPGCDMEADAYGIPKPKGTQQVIPSLLLIPCIGFGPNGMRLGYGGGFYDHTLAAMKPRPHTIGLAYSMGYLPDIKPERYDVPLAVILTENSIAWPLAE